MKTLIVFLVLFSASAQAKLSSKIDAQIQRADINAALDVSALEKAVLVRELHLNIERETPVQTAIVCSNEGVN